MQLLAANAGSFPKPDTGAGSNLLQQVIQDQIQCGLDLVTDGQIYGQDPVSHIAGKLTGVELGGTIRLFGSGLEVRQPVIRGPFAWAVPVARPEFEAAQAISSKPVKAVLCSALTLARHSLVLDPYYRRDFARLVNDFSEALVLEVRELVTAGATIIQIDEPALLLEHEPEDLRIIKHCWRRLAMAKGSAKLVLNVAFGDPTEVLDELFRLSADVVALDLTSNPRLADILAHLRTPKQLALGVVDGGRPELESAAAIAGMVEKILPEQAASVCYLTPSCGLGDLPREAALAKLKLVAGVRDLFERASAGAPALA